MKTATFAANPLDHRRFLAGRCPYQSPGGGSPIAAPRARHRPPSDGIIGHVDALYALAYLSSGDADRSQQVVIDTLTALSSRPFATIPCRPQLWRTLADRVHITSRGLEGSSVVGPAPFRDSALPTDQREALALRLGGRHDREAARLLGVSRARFLLHLRAGLIAIQATAVRAREDQTLLD